MNSSDAAVSAGAAGILILFYLVIIGLILAVYWKITAKAGYPGWYALGMLVPCLNLVLLLMFAFTEWPIERELKHLRSLQNSQSGYPRFPDPSP